MLNEADILKAFRAIKNSEELVEKIINIPYQLWPTPISLKDRVVNTIKEYKTSSNISLKKGMFFSSAVGISKAPSSTTSSTEEIKYRLSIFE